MIYQTEYGTYWSPFFQAEKEYGVEKLVITGYLLMPYSGYCAQVLRGAICLLIMVTGKTRIAVFVAGATRESGRPFWSNW
jgi:hypothetical protein